MVARDVRAVEEPELSFAGLLRQLRQEAQLTQEELAEAARLSPRSVSDLERGINRTARKDTALLLAGALSLAGQVRELFVAAARGRAPAAEVLEARKGAALGAFAASATRALPRDIAAFTGRRAELAQLMGTLATATVSCGVVGIHAIDGMAGIGKTTFAVHAAHRLADAFPDGQFFLPLHAHTAGQQPVDPADALASLLLTAGVAAQQIPPGLQARAGRWRGHVAGKKILLLLDDAAGHEQVRPLLPGTAGSLVLVTSRRRLTALDDATVISLGVLAPGEAAALLARLAGRPDLAAGTGPAEKIIRLCGYLPLAIGMLARKLRHHPTWSAATLAADLEAATDRLTVMRAENLSVAVAFDLSYADLSPDQQQLFRRLGLVPGPSIDPHAAAALDDTSLDTAHRRLNELYDQHLLDEPTPARYQLHDLLRQHARALAATDSPAACDAATGRLLDYYLYAALAAAQRIPTWTAAQGLAPPEAPSACIPDLFTLGQAAGWLDTERANLHAAADRAAASGRHLHAVQIPAAIGDFLRAHGDWDQAAQMHRTALAAARQAGDLAGQALALRQLGILAWLKDDFPAAAAHLTQAAQLYREAGDKPGQAYALTHLGQVQQRTGYYPAATSSRKEALALARDASDRLAEAVALNHLSEVQQLTGDYRAATATVEEALALFRRLGHRLGEADALSNLGGVQQKLGDYPAATASLTRSLAIFRDLGHRIFESTVLSALGLVQQLAGDYAHATASLQRALQMQRDLGSRLHQAETLNSLGELSTRTSATSQAQEHHAQALAIARDIGVPLEEARALEGIGHIHLQDGNPSEGLDCLRQALAIYQRIGASAARRVRETLEHHGLTSIAAEPAAGTPSSEEHQPPAPTEQAAGHPAARALRRQAHPSLDDRKCEREES